jgi:phosphoglycolate phosphatase-like HAD superfamily hydrolase
LILLAALVIGATGGAQPRRTNPLTSWNDTATKKALLAFVAKVTREGSPDFVPPAERVAVFDNDGALWCEHPMYVELAFALDRVQVLAGKHPERRNTQPFKALIEGDHKALAEAGKKRLVEILVATHTGMAIEEFEATVMEWLATAKHPKFDRPYTECVFQPMLEVLAYLRANSFKTFIVSGGTADFMRPFAERVYGVPPEQVVGTTFQTKYIVRDGKPVVVIEPSVDLIDDGPGKPVGIARLIGRKPVMKFGNSDGDFEMLEYTTSRKGARFGLFVHHTDTEREYDRKTPFGKLDRGLDAAPKRSWVVVSMKDDWKTVFPERNPK